MKRFLTSPLSKQKQAPLSVLSTHQSTFFPLAMRDASERSSSSCRPAARTIKQSALSILQLQLRQRARQGGWGLIIPADLATPALHATNAASNSTAMFR